MQHETLAKAFVEQYYKLFDKKDTRAQVANLYHVTESQLRFEGANIQGAEAIMQKYSTMPFNNIFREITTLDAQLLTAGGLPGILIQILGQLRTDSENDHVMGFSQTFVLRHVDNNYFLFNDIFRLVIHNV